MSASHFTTEETVDTQDNSTSSSMENKTLTSSPSSYLISELSTSSSSSTNSEAPSDVGITMNVSETVRPVLETSILIPNSQQSSAMLSPSFHSFFTSTRIDQATSGPSTSSLVDLSSIQSTTVFDNNDNTISWMVDETTPWMPRSVPANDSSFTFNNVFNWSSATLIDLASSAVAPLLNTTRTPYFDFENTTPEEGLVGNATGLNLSVPDVDSPTTLMTSLANSSSRPFGGTMTDKERDLRDFVTGLALAVSSSVFIGSSFILKKLGLIRYAKKVSLRAGQGGLGYLREWMWWAGMILMTVGEFANFAAYAFAPATLVTPLGALSVIVSAVLSARILREKLNILGKIGCVLCVLGSTLMVIHSPKEQEVHDVEDLMIKMKEPGFIVYALFILITCIVMIVYFSPRYGQKNVLVYITICAGLGSFTVMGCKGVGTAITATARGHNEFKNWLTYVLLGVVIVCILLQLNYLNKALDTFNTAVVTPIYYVFFTSCVIMGSAILFREFFKMAALDIIGDLCGFLVIIIGIFLLNAFKDVRISLRNLPGVSKDAEATENSETADGIAGLNGVKSSNYLVDCQDIEAEISRNMAVEGITRDVSQETTFSESSSHSLNVKPYRDNTHM